jgi:hypothetical protein
VRRATPKTVQGYYDRLPPHHRKLAEAVRRIVLSATPGMQESLMWSKPWFGNGPGLANAVCYLAAQRDHVNFGFARGTSLSDPDGVLEGTGKSMRHVKIRGEGDVRPKLFASWVRQGVAFNRERDSRPSRATKRRKRPSARPRSTR